MFGKDATDNQILEVSLFSELVAIQSQLKMFKFRRYIVTPFCILIIGIVTIN